MEYLPVTVDKSHLITIGERLYSESIELIRELVNNAYDADATEVNLLLTDDRIEIRDNGTGMDREGLKQYLTSVRPKRLGNPNRRYSIATSSANSESENLPAWLPANASRSIRKKGILRPKSPSTRKSGGKKGNTGTSRSRFWLPIPPRGMARPLAFSNSQENLNQKKLYERLWRGHP